MIVDLKGGGSELFNIMEDPEEQEDLAHRYPAKVAELKQMIASHFSGNVSGGEAPSVQPSRRNLEQLEALGYVE